MAHYRIRRNLIEVAISRALQGEKANLIDLTPLTGMNIDAAFIILRKTETLRNEAERKGLEITLRSHVRRAAVASGLPPDRRYAYEVVVMNYYGLIKEYLATRRKAWKQRVAASIAQQAA